MTQTIPNKNVQTPENRAQFESEFAKLSEGTAYKRFFNRVIDDSRYESMEVEWGWRMWQARGMFEQQTRGGMSPNGS